MPCRHILFANKYKFELADFDVRHWVSYRADLLSVCKTVPPRKFPGCLQHVVFESETPLEAEEQNGQQGEEQADTHDSLFESEVQDQKFEVKETQQDRLNRMRASHGIFFSLVNESWGHVERHEQLTRLLIDCMTDTRNLIVAQVDLLTGNQMVHQQNSSRLPNPSKDPSRVISREFKAATSSRFKSRGEKKNSMKRKISRSNEASKFLATQKREKIEAAMSSTSTRGRKKKPIDQEISEMKRQIKGLTKKETQQMIKRRIESTPVKYVETGSSQDPGEQVLVNLTGETNAENGVSTIDLTSSQNSRQDGPSESVSVPKNLFYNRYSEIFRCQQP